MTLVFPTSGQLSLNVTLTFHDFYVMHVNGPRVYAGRVKRGDVTPEVCKIAHYYLRTGNIPDIQMYANVKQREKLGC